jgi:AI-2 transport protein TqsA
LGENSLNRPNPGSFTEKLAEQGNAMNNLSGFRDSVLTIAGIMVILLTVRYAQGIVVPVLLALLISIIAAVPVGWLKKRGLPLPIAVGIVMILVVLIDVLLVLLLAGAITSFTESLPNYQARLDEIWDVLSTWFLSKGVDLSETSFREVMDPKAALIFVKNFIQNVGELLGNELLITLTVLFILLEGWSFPAKINAMESVRSGKIISEAVKVINSTKKYLAIKTITSLATGVIVAVGLALVGLDFAGILGFLTFALNFIPTIGSFIAAVPAVLLALLQFGPLQALIVIAIFLAVNIVIGNIIEPRVMGHRVGLSPLVVFLSMVFWGWMFGPVGMLLSVPLTMIIKFAAETREQSRWLAMLLSPAPLPAAPAGVEDVNTGEQR